MPDWTFPLSLWLAAMPVPQTPSPAAPRPSQPRQVVAAITAAVDRGRADSVRRYWEARARKNRSDPGPQFALATLDRLEYRYQPAEDRFGTLSQRLDPADRRWGTWGILGLALTRIQRWDIAGALPLLDRALAAADSTGEPSAAGTALLALTRIAARSVGPDSVEQLVARARRTAPAFDSTLTAQVLCAAGATVRSRGLATSDSLTRRGIALARAAQDQRTLGSCLVTLSQLLETGGHQGPASDALDEAIAVIDRTRDAYFAASAHQQAAFRFIQYTFGLANGRVHAVRAIELSQQSGNRLAGAYARLNLAQLAVRLGDLREATRRIDSARVLFDRLGDRFGLAASEFVAGDAAFAAGRLTDAKEAFRRSEEQYRRMGSPVTQITVRQALLAIAEDRPDDASRLLDDATASAERIGAAGGVKADRVYYDGLIALRRGQGAVAAELFAKYGERVPRRAFQYRLDANLREAEALSLTGRLTDAERRLDSAFAMINQVRQAISDTNTTNRDVLQALTASRRFEFDPDLGLATTIQRLVAGGRVAAALRFAEAERARNLWLRLSQRRLLGRDSTSVGARGRIGFPAQLDVEELERALDPATAIIEFTTGAGGEPTTVFVLDRQSLRGYTAPAADSLAEPIARFADGVAGGGWPRSLARTLGNLLLDSALAALPASVNRLILLPDGPLYRLPFDAVVMPNGQPLVQRYALSTAPSARLAAEWLGQRAAAAGPSRVIAFGDARFESKSGLRRLLGSGEEALIATGRGARGRTLLGAAASEAALKQTRREQASVLHLATHARTEDWGVLTSAVYLSPGEGEDGRVGPEEIAELALPVDLVVLSGCRTSGGMVVFGEGIQGLVAPFLEAGAKAVVATYWEVKDREIVPMISRLYHGLASGLSAGAALHGAKLAAYRAGEPPSRWAALSLTGDPDVRPLAVSGRSP